MNTTIQDPVEKNPKIWPDVASPSNGHPKIEQRLGGILCCAVCMKMPRTIMYQCHMGHLMCFACYTGRLGGVQVATCPNCSVEISPSTVSRNLAVEKAILELPSKCHYCNKEFPSKSIERHQLCECDERTVTEAKRQKLVPGLASTSKGDDKLELRLRHIMRCTVCLSLPKMTMYQCEMGHLMCVACFTNLHAEQSTLRNEGATCPQCRTKISQGTATRNVAVEKAIMELPSECQYCKKELPTKLIERHEQHECEERPITCKYLRIGCQWKGPSRKAIEHQKNCLQPGKSGADVMKELEATDGTQMKLEDTTLFVSTLIELFSSEKVVLKDLQIRLYPVTYMLLFSSYMLYNIYFCFRVV